MQYSTSYAGTYKVSILLGGENIAGSPFDVFVNGAAAVPSKSTARPGYTAVCTAGKPGELVVEARDRFGNAKVYDLVTPPDNIQGVLSGIDTYIATKEIQKSSGSFILSWTAEKTGLYNLAVTLNSEEISAASLDTTKNEPLENTSSLWTAKNCFISAHDSAHSLKSLIRAFELFFQNIKNIQNGQPIKNLYSE